MTAFEQLGLEPELLRGIEALGFTTPTPIQELVIPVALSDDNNILALAQTGTGKTAAFGLPLLQRIDGAARNEVQGLVLCPTRELCVQVAKDLENYSQFAYQYKVVAVYGGAGIEGQIRQIKAGAQIVVATPGRLMDLLTRKAIRLDQVRRVVLDEADEMLDMGFKEAIDFILGAASNRKSVWLFSATMPEAVRAIASNYMDNPLELSAGKRNQTNENIEHIYYVCRMDDRFSTLKRVVDSLPGIYGLVFCRTKNDTKEVAEQMIRDGYNADALHGDLAQSDRDRVMQRFRENNLQLLVATDVAARGLDVQNISHVINYNLPDEIEVYTHRSGRTGRAGKTGVSISIITPKLEEKIRLIERKTKAVFTRKSIPTGVEVCEQQLMHIIHNIREQEVHTSEIEPFMPQIMEELKDFSKEDLIKRFASVEFNRFLQYYRNAPDINIYAKGDKRRQAQQGEASGFQRLFLNVGEMDGIDKRDHIHLLTRTVGVPNRAIGQIEFSRSFLHFDLEASFVETVRTQLPEFSINNRRLRVDDAAPRQTKSKPGGKGPDKFNRGGGNDKFKGKGGKPKGKGKW